MTFGRYTLAPGPEWTGLAAAWPVRYVTRFTEDGHWLTGVIHPDLAGSTLAQAHLICASCEQSVFCLHPGTGGAAGYATTAADILAGVLRHVRECHEDAIPPA